MINGYARMKGYWEDSKGGLSTYTFVKDKIWTGVYNAHLIRWKSNTLHQNEYYERNPYVDVDYIFRSIPVHFPAAYKA